MVYRGKPSAACGECRKRRTRCDLAVPACGQCIRTKRLCPGYRTTSDLIICDQSNSVAIKSKSQGLPLRHPPSTGAYSPLIHADSRVANHGFENPPVQLGGFAHRFILEDVAVKHFMAHYIGQDAESSQFGYLPGYYKDQGFNYAELQESLKAVGLAGYARSTRRADLLFPATKSYVAAVRSVNHAMSGPNLAGRAATLISVMLLSLFEVMILPRASGLENLTKHLKGAMSIAHLSIKETKLADVHRKLLGTVIQAVVITYWVQEEPLPPEFFILKKEAFFHPDSIHAQFLHMIIEVMQYRDALNEGDFPQASAALEEARRLEVQLGRFARGLSRHAPYDSVDVPKLSEEPVYNGVYHVYPSSIAAHLWNNLRSSRIYLHQTILAQLSTTSTSLTTDQQTWSETMLEDLAAEVCASVPQLADYIEQLPSYIDRDLNDAETRFKVAKYIPGQPLLSLSLTTATVELSAHFIYDPGPFRYTSPRLEHDNGSVPRPASLYHAYYHLSKLESIQSLPARMKGWIQGRLRWIEEMGDPHDLDLMKALLQQSRARQKSCAPPTSSQDASSHNTPSGKLTATK